MGRRGRVAPSWVAACALTALVGCGGGDDPAGSSGDAADGATPASHVAPTVLSAFYPIHEIVVRVGGDDVDAVNLTPPGGEPHDIELTSDDIEQVEAADAIFYLGDGFMPGLERALRRARGEKVDLLEGLPLVKGGHDHGHGHGEEDEEAASEGDAHDGEEQEHDGEGEFDPHVWLDPHLMIRLTQQVEETLSTVNPDAEADYAERAEQYRAELRALHDEFATTLVDCQRNVFVTSHAAFGYLARRYQLQEEAVTGLTPETEPEPERIAELADLVDDLGVPVVFAETLLPTKLAETLAREADVTVGVLNPIEGLTDDELRDGADYLSVMRDNLAALDSALDCVGAADEAPAG